MEIQNKNLNKYEKSWLEKLLSADFPLKKGFFHQINQADIIRQYTDYYLSLQFAGICPTTKERSEYIGVPIEMRVYLEGSVPIHFLLHVKKGIVSELEIFKADSSKINSALSLDDAEIEILIDPGWK